MVRSGSVSTIRVVIAKPGLDGHDRGAKVIARALRDAGMEVIYTGLHQTPEQIVETAIQEDADAVGISILSGAHMTLVPRILDLLRDRDADDVLVVVGGTIPGDDIAELKRLGVAEVFTPGAPTGDIVDFLRAPGSRPSEDRGLREGGAGRRVRRAHRPGDDAARPQRRPRALRVRRARDRGGAPPARGDAARARSGSSRWARRRRWTRCARGSRWAPTARCSSPTTRSPAPTSSRPSKALAAALARVGARPRPLRPAVGGRRTARASGPRSPSGSACPVVSQAAELTIADGALDREAADRVRLRDARARRCRRSSPSSDAINEPRYPSLKGIMGAKSKPQETLVGAPRRRRRRERDDGARRSSRRRRAARAGRIEGGADTAAAIVDFLAERRLL